MLFKNKISRFIYGMMAVCAAIVPAACADDSPESPDASGVAEAGYITIGLRSGTATRADEGYVDDSDRLNENLIKTALVCLYPNNNPSGKPVALEFVDNINENTDATVKVFLNDKIRQQLFPGSVTTCQVYVAANITAEQAAQFTVASDIEDIRNMILEDDFNSKAVREMFAMDGDATLDLEKVTDSDRYAATGNVTLRRVASRIVLAVKIAESVESNGETWYPVEGDILASIHNGVGKTTFTPSAYTPEYPADYFSTDNAIDGEEYHERVLATGISGASADFPLQLGEPFYTMPNKWDDNNLSNNNMTYLTLRVPWRRQGASSAVFQYCYYTVPVVKGNEIGRNIAYKVNLNVNMLGSFTPDEPFVVDDLSYYAVEWGSVSQDVNISETRYLVVDRESYTLNNDPDLDIPFYTSHETIITEASLTYYRYNYNANGTEQAVTITDAVNEASKNATARDGNQPGEVYTRTISNTSLGDSEDMIHFQHELVEWQAYNSNNSQIPLISGQTNNNRTVTDIRYYLRPTTPDESYTRYKATIIIAHKDLWDPTKSAAEQSDECKAFMKTLTITQYPQMYIEATQNYPQTGSSAAMGNMFVNGHQATRYNDNNQRYWYVTYGLSSSSNTNSNPNQYVINVTQLNEGEDYIIGDPRIEIPTNLNKWKNNFGNNNQSSPDNRWVSAPRTYATGNGRLTNYYPTDSLESKSRWIAPKFRIASSYGVCYPQNYRTQRARCASYQELSRPAGRWRVPTVAEIEYIMKLSQQNKIPKLFDEDAEYMSAQGVVSTTFKNGKLVDPNISGSAAVRCVYDEWYWGNDTITPSSYTGTGANRRPVYDFTWGDKPRQ